MNCREALRAYSRRATYCACAVLACAGAQRAAAVPLREDQTLTATESAVERFTYEVELADAGARVLRVEQRGLDLIVAVQPPSGAARSFNSPLFRDGAETVVLDAGPGRYRVEVYSTESTNAAGGHAITLTRLGAAADAREREALQLMTAGAAANFASGEAGWAAAVEAYERAANLWHDLGRKREEADALFAVGIVEYWQRFAWMRGAELAAQAAALYDGLGETVLHANAVHLEAASLVEQALEIQQSAEGSAIAPESEALFAAALQLLEQVRVVHERLGNVYDLALVVNNFGYTYYSKGDFQRARTYYEQAAALQDSIGEWGAEVQPLANIAILDAEAGRLTSAIQSFEKVLAVLPPGRLLNYRANALDNLGATHLLRGDLEQALQIFATALALQREIDDGQGEGRSLRRIGEAYYMLGERELAQQYLQQALPIAVRTNDGRTQEATLRNLGNVAFLERDYAGALDFHRRALEISASTSDRAHLQLLVAKDLNALGRAAEAQQAAAAAKDFATSTSSDLLLAGAANAAGRAQIVAGEPATATANLERAAALYQRLGLGPERAEALHGLALAARAANRIDRALEYGAASLHELELLRLRVADPELRAFFASSRRDYYETQVDLLMARGRSPSDDSARAAFDVSERSRARMIADLLQEAAVDLRDTGSPELRAKEAALYEQLADRRRQRDLLLDPQAPGSAPPVAELARVVADLAALENSLNLLEIDLRRGNPKYANLTAPETLSAAQIQPLLGADTVLLQYSLGTDASYVWAVTNERLAVVKLADRAVIETAARRALAALQTPTPGVAAPAAQAPEVAELAALVLVPVAAHLDRARVVLALDGALQFVPFAALPVARDGAAPEPLLANHEVVEVPSVSALMLAARSAEPVARKTLAVFADPVLEATDSRFGAQSARLVAAAAQPAAFAARSSLGAPLGRLLSTGYEGEAIAALVPDDRRLFARGFTASRSAVLHADLKDFRYIHFATHGLVDSRYPGLSALVLSQFDEQGRAQDGFLRLNDIYNLKLGAELVVLSACDTALGREVRGEGLIGLTQGFMAAGARSLVASLWQVPDRATAELMRQFYGYMLNDGLRPAAALRKAQLWSAAQRRWSDPYYWGGFVIIGDWR